MKSNCNDCQGNWSLYHIFYITVIRPHFDLSSHAIIGKENTTEFTFAFTYVKPCSQELLIMLFVEVAFFQHTLHVVYVVSFADFK